MVALIVSALLVSMILAIFSRMSLAYRGQQQIAGVQQVLAAARATMELDAKQAGLAMPEGFKLASDPASPQRTRSAIQVINNSSGPDEIRFFYADPTIQAAVTAAASPPWPNPLTLAVDSTSLFNPGDVVVISTLSTASSSPHSGSANLATYDACVVRIASMTATSFTFDSAAPWGKSNTGHCRAVTTRTMIYRFVARAYRIDTSTAARAELGPLQLSETGGLLGAGDSWMDLAYGFTDLQTALRVYDTAASDADADGDPIHNWWSGAYQTTVTATQVVPTPPSFNPVPIQMSISLVARTDREIEGIASTATPQLLDPLHPDNNERGDRASVALPSATDPALGGSRIYRFATFQVDLRNLGVGR
jgi:hypothetical protein